MTFFIKDYSEFTLLVNGMDMQIGADGLKACTIIENTTSALPTVSLTFCDTRLKAIPGGAFTDGAKIDIVMGDGTNPPITYNFIQWSAADITANAAGEVASISAVATPIPWLTKLIAKEYTGTSSSIIQQVAQEGGITNTDMDATQDSMIWLPNSKTFHQFARDAQDHGWMGASSSPLIAVTSDQTGQWQLRYKDILKQNPSQTMAMLPFFATGQIPIHDFRAHSDALFHNTWVNYGYKLMQEQLDGTLATFFNMSISSLTSNIGISSAASGAVNLVRSLYHSPNVGNTHEHYAEAAHHNLKAQSAFTTTIHTMTNQLTTLRLLDDVNLILANSDGTINGAYSGVYKISSISRHISKGNYREKFVLMSQGINATFSGGAGA